MEYGIGYCIDGPLEYIKKRIFETKKKSVEEMMREMVLITDAKYCDKYTMKNGNK